MERNAAMQHFELPYKYDYSEGFGLMPERDLPSGQKVMKYDFGWKESTDETLEIFEPSGCVVVIRYIGENGSDKLTAQVQSNMPIYQDEDGTCRIQYTGQ